MFPEALENVFMVALTINDNKWQLGWILNSWFNLYFLPLNSAAIIPMPSGFENCYKEYPGLRLACLLDNLVFLPAISQESLKLKNFTRIFPWFDSFCNIVCSWSLHIPDSLFQKYFLLLYIWMIFLLNIFWFIFKDTLCNFIFWNFLRSALYPCMFSADSDLILLFLMWFWFYNVCFIIIFIYLLSCASVLFVKPSFNCFRQEVTQDFRL